MTNTEIMVNELNQIINLLNISFTQFIPVNDCVCCLYRYKVKYTQCPTFFPVNSIPFLSCDLVP